ncbi:PfkB family carbohydrate kinase [Aureimonas psammosilenae]|uniref:PfkB family carbohydrate kinase n=1 Tax=Aureimonas psammosilenae TaxID=2495496 RepID=UPI0012610BFD|nr:PfkB family carbohydrate kinase [Aureimonas psammosilenae]
MTRVLAVGDNVVDCYPATNQMFPGGNCLNVSVLARRFGAETGYVGAVGQDAAGAAIRTALASEGVRLDRLRVLPGTTAYCIIGHRANGDRVFLKFDLSVSMFEPDEADVAFAAGFDAVHIGQSSGLDAHLPRFAGVSRLSYDFSIRREAEHRRAIAPLCFLASISAGDLSRDEADALMRETLAAGAKWCLVTRGEEGALLGAGTHRYETAAHPVEVVDTLGAGDTFVARTLVGLLRKEDPAELMRAAARAAAETCTRVGAIGHASAMAVDARDIPALAKAC